MQLRRNEIMTGLLVVGTVAILVGGCKIGPEACFDCRARDDTVLVRISLKQLRWRMPFFRRGRGRFGLATASREQQNGGCGNQNGPRSRHGEIVIADSSGCSQRLPFATADPTPLRFRCG